MVAQDQGRIEQKERSNNEVKLKLWVEIFFWPFFFFFGPFFLGGVPGFSFFLGTGGQGHGAGDAPRGCGVETRGPGLGSQPGNAATHLYIYTYLCIYIYTHSYI